MSLKMKKAKDFADSGDWLVIDESGRTIANVYFDRQTATWRDRDVPLEAHYGADFMGFNKQDVLEKIEGWRAGTKKRWSPSPIDNPKKSTTQYSVGDQVMRTTRGLTKEQSLLIVAETGIESIDNRDRKKPAVRAWMVYFDDPTDRPDLWLLEEIRPAKPNEREPGAETKFLRRNPAELAPGRRALKMYTDFHQLEPKKIGAFGSSFAIPSEVVLAGPAKNVLYRSGKRDPATLKKPPRPLDYIHEHDDGVKVYRTDLRDGSVRRVPDFITGVGELVLLGQCLGFAYLDHDGEEIEAQVRTPYPELYTIPSGRALLVVQDKRRVLALIWGGRLGVEPRGIVH
jgi:hypothetical protein